MAGEVHRRFFSNPNAPIKTGDTAGDFKANQNLFWRDPEDKSLIRNFGSDVRVSFGESLSSDQNNSFIGTRDGEPFAAPVRNRSTGGFGVQARGIYRANVTVTLANLSADLIGPTKSYDQFKSLNLTMTRHTNLVIDSWGARDPGQVESRVSNFLVHPGSTPLISQVLFTAVNAGVAIMEQPRAFPGVCFDCGPRLGRLGQWSDEVPNDRLR